MEGRYGVPHTGTTGTRALRSGEPSVGIRVRASAAQFGALFCWAGVWQDRLMGTGWEWVECDVPWKPRRVAGTPEQLFSGHVVGELLPVGHDVYLRLSSVRPRGLARQFRACPVIAKDKLAGVGREGWLLIRTDAHVATT